MVGYTILEVDNLPEILKNKPRWVTCAAFAAGVMAITVSAVAAGAVFGYAYCYFEHKSGFATGNLTQSTNFKILHMPYVDSSEARKNRTINGALLSSVLVSRILQMGHAFMVDELASLT